MFVLNECDIIQLQRIKEASNMNKIKEFRVKNKITIRQLSEKTGVAVGYISTLENDKNGTSNPTKDVMIRIANGLGHTVPEVFF